MTGQTSTARICGEGSSCWAVSGVDFQTSAVHGELPAGLQGSLGDSSYRVQVSLLGGAGRAPHWLHSFPSGRSHSRWVRVGVDGHRTQAHLRPCSACALGRRLPQNLQSSCVAMIKSSPEKHFAKQRSRCGWTCLRILGTVVSSILCSTFNLEVS